MRTLIFLLFSLVLFVSCGKKSGSSSSSKQLFSKWQSSTGTSYLDFTGGQFDVNSTLFLYVPITQSWINDLNAGNRDTTGLVAGGYTLCEMSIYFVGTNKSGNVSTNHDDVDEPAHNACMEWDSNCSIGTCNYNGDHLYTNDGKTLKIDYFGTADSAIYGTGTLK